MPRRLAAASVLIPRPPAPARRQPAGRETARATASLPPLGSPLYLRRSSQTRKRARELLSFLLIPTGPTLIPAADPRRQPPQTSRTS